MGPVIREELADDVAAVRTLNTSAFESDAEAKLVDALRAAGGLVLSLVAELDGEIVGHIAFSPVVVESRDHATDGVGLAPMAVAPAYRRQGIGGGLIDVGLRRLHVAGHRFCVVLGHADYYPRHGFIKASQFGIRWERPVPEDIFFVRELAPEGLTGVSGTVRYRAEFEAV
jgi:putative acetyltransferase